MVEESKIEQMLSVLVVEHDEKQGRVVIDALSQEGYDVHICSNRDDALDRLRKDCYSVVVTGRHFDNASEIELLNFVKQQCPNTVVIIHTAFGSLESAKEAIHHGAFAYVEEKSGIQEVVKHLKRASQDLLKRSQQATLEHYTDFSTNHVDVVDPERGIGVGTAVKETTDQKHIEAAHVRQQTDVAKLGLAALETSTSELLGMAVKLIAKTLNVEYAKVLELSDSGSELLLRSGVGWRAGLVGSTWVGTNLDSQAGLTLQSTQPVIVRDLREERRFSGPALLLSHGVVSGVSVVIHGSPTPYGVLGVHTQQRRDFNDAEVSYLQSVANVLTDAIRLSHAQSQLRLTQFAVDQYRGGCTRIGPEGRFNYVNETACHSLGYSQDEMLKLCVWDIDPAWPQEKWAAGWQRLRKAVSTNFESQYCRKDGTLVPVEVTANYISFEDEEFVFAFATDITRRKQAEDRYLELVAELAHVSRLSSMGEMVSVLAHEVNQPLGTIANYAGTCVNLLKHERIKLTDLRPILEKINEQTLRAGNIISSLKSVVSKAVPKQTNFDINALCSDVKELLKAEADSKDIIIELDLTPNLPHLQGDPIQLQQVLVNLTKNGIEATNRLRAGQGRVVIKTSRDQDYVYVWVADEGTGVESDRVNRIFEPYFTSKNEGLEMGLNISRAIVAAHGGKLMLTNNTESGAEFSFSIPLHEASTTTKQAAH